MKRRKVLAMLMTAVMTFTSVAPETALMVHAEDDVVIEEAVEEEGETAAQEDAASENEAVSANEAEETAEEEEAVSENEAEETAEETDETEESVSENEAEEEETVSENEAVSGNEAVSENEAEETVSAELPYGLKGMPADYVMSEQQKFIKDDAAAHDLGGDVTKFTEGVDYEADTVYFLAEDEEYAKTVAEAYNAELASFDGYVATLDLTNSGITVAEAIAVGANPEYNMPAVDADYIITVGTGYEGWTDERINNAYSYEDKNTEDGWADIVGQMGSRDPRLNPNDKNYQWWHDVVGSYSAWGVMGYNFGSSGIKVAVIDTGVNSSHEEFSGHLSIVNGTDANGHGSNVAGIIGASANNGKGGAGVAPGIQLIGYNVTKPEGGLDSSKIASAIIDAANKGANIINMSLGGPGYNSNYVSAINYAYGKDVTIIAAAGNEAANTVSYPAFYDHVISVAASQPDGTLTTFSNFGDDIVDIAAPGADMYSCNMGAASSYVKMQGTSQASPVVAGVCAVYMSINGKVKPDQMLKVLKDNATKTSTPGDGAGIVNLGKMLKADTTGPKISFKDANGKDVVVEGGKSGSATVLADAQLNFTYGSFNGNANGNKETSVFFTINGKTPSFDKRGEANYGTYQCTDKQVKLNQYPFYASALGDKYTVKAITVNGMGIVSKVTTVKLTIGVGVDNGLSSIYGPSKLAAGLSGSYFVYGSKKSGSKTSSQILKSGVTWELTSGSEYATINKTSGVLKVNKGVSSGKTVGVKATYKGYSKSMNVTVGGEPVKTITLSDTKANLSYYKDSAVLGTTYQKTFTITEVKDAKGNVITNNNSYSCSSSNYSVVSWSTSNNGKTITLTANGKGTARVTIYANDGSNAKAVINVTVVNLVSWLDISGQDDIEQGGKASYKAYVYPTNAKLKTLKWSVWANYNKTGAVAGVTVDEKKGTVSVDKSVAVGRTFYVFAEATDGSGAYDYKYVKVVPAKAKNITFKANVSDAAYKLNVNSKTGSLAAMQLFTVNAPSSAVDETQATVTATVDTNCDVEWSSSNWEVVNVSSGGKNVYLTAKSKGVATITCKALDGSGKKASFRVNVIVPVSNLTLSNAVVGTYADETGKNATTSYVAVGKAVKTKVTVGQSYGKPSNPKVVWETRPVYVSSSGSIVAMTDAQADAVLKAKLVSGSNGSAMFNKNYMNMYKNYVNGYSYIAIMQTAKTTDGTNISMQRMVSPMLATEAVVAQGSDGKWGTNVTWYFRAEAPFGYGYTIPINWKGAYGADFSVKSSNTKVATAYFDTDYECLVVSWGATKGTAKLTITAKDGTSKKCTVNIVVR